MGQQIGQQLPVVLGVPCFFENLPRNPQPRRLCRDSGWFKGKSINNQRRGSPDLAPKVTVGTLCGGLPVVKRAPGVERCLVGAEAKHEIFRLTPS